MPSQYPAKKNVRVMDLVPGDVVVLPMGDRTCTYVERVPQHPLYSEGFSLVIWREGNYITGKKGDWHLDALSEDQVVGTTWQTNDENLKKSLRWVLGGG